MEEPLEIVTERNKENEDLLQFDRGVGLGICYGSLGGIVVGAIMGNVMFGLSLGAVIGIIAGVGYDEVKRRLGKKKV